MAVTPMAGNGWLRRLSLSAPVPIFVVRAIGGDDGMAVLRASAGVSVVDSPRHATVLVIAGRVPRSSLPALAAVTDQVPRPCGVAAISVSGDLTDLGLGRIPVLSEDDPATGLLEIQGRVLSGEVDLAYQGPEENPVEWQGKGSNGQGGDGMMGGVPYGRMMPMPPTEGRDGLALDRLGLVLGPFLSGLPAGVMLTVGLQGDVLETVEVQVVDLDDGVVGDPPAHPLTGPAETAARALGALSQMCALAGLGALATRVARVAIAPTPSGINDLRSRLGSRWGLRAATDKIAAGRPGGAMDVDVTSCWQGWLDVAEAAMGDVTEEKGVIPERTDVDLQQVSDRLLGQDIGQAWLTLCAHTVELEALVARRLAMTGAA